MKRYLYEIISNSGNLSTEDIIIRIVVAAALGGAIFLSYWITHSGTIYSRKFNITLLTLTILTATVMTVIGNNIALSLGMVGALSIIRFRTSIKDSRDTIYIFWTIIVGICCGRLCGGGCRQLRRISGAASVRPCPQRKSNAADHPGAAG